MTDGFKTWSKRDSAVDGLVVVGGMSRVGGDYVDVDFGVRAGENVGLSAVDYIQGAD